MSEGVAGIVLAAGQSRRFGSNKLLHPLPDGTPLVLASARALRSVLPRTLAVVARDDDDVSCLLANAGVELVVNPDASRGMGSSIACGVGASPGAAGWLIALGDMPCVPPRVIGALLAALQAGSELVAPVYGRRRGHPVGFAAGYASVLCALDGDSGARAILHAHRDALTSIDVDTDSILFDIDTPADVSGLAGR